MFPECFYSGELFLDGNGMVINLVCQVGAYLTAAEPQIGKNTKRPVPLTDTLFPFVSFAAATFQIFVPEFQHVLPTQSVDAGKRRIPELLSPKGFKFGKNSESQFPIISTNSPIRIILWQIQWTSSGLRR